MSTLDRICALEVRRSQLLRLDHRDGRELAELGDINALLPRLWEHRRCEMTNATTQPLDEYRAHRAGLVSVENRVKIARGLRKEVPVS